MDTRRAEAFSDGVFAVAITVLVFNLLEINPEILRLQDLTAKAWPSYFAYVVSFLTIGIMWMNHHTIFSHIARVDRAVLVLNLFLLLGIVAIPWPTALVAKQLQHSGGALAAVTYGLVMILISVGFGGLWINAYSYLPLKMITGVGTSQPGVATWSFLTPTQAHLAQLRPHIPLGFPHSPGPQG